MAQPDTAPHGTPAPPMPFLPGSRRRPTNRCRTPSPSTSRVTRSGTSTPSSTRCWSAASTTPTATAPATCAASISRLDYLQWLGIDCIWLLPIYDSPLRDGGYDIADFTAILPEFGTIGDFVELVEEAHKRGIRVIADLVMNHTSDQHPWFQASRATPTARSATSTCGRTPTTSTRTPGSSSSTPSSPTGPSTRCAASTTGTGSSTTSPT